MTPLNSKFLSVSKNQSRLSAIHCLQITAWGENQIQRSIPASPCFASALEKVGLVLILAGLVAAGTGCASIQVTDSSTGLPRVIGFGSATNIPVSKGTVCRLCSPGLSLRLHSYDPGLTLGWHETLLFLPESSNTNSKIPARPIGIAIKDYGIHLAPFHLMIGGDYFIGVYESDPGLSIRQTIQFDSHYLTKTIITKEESK